MDTFFTPNITLLFIYVYFNPSFNYKIDLCYLTVLFDCETFKCVICKILTSPMLRTSEYGYRHRIQEDNVSIYIHTHIFKWTIYGSANEGKD